MRAHIKNELLDGGCPYEDKENRGWSRRGGKRSGVQLQWKFWVNSLIYKPEEARKSTLGWGYKFGYQPISNMENRGHQVNTCS